jgi:tetratricopeptide (TPR) repeat protein
LELLEKLAEGFPTEHDYQNLMGGARHGLAKLSVDQGEWMEARRLLEKAIAHQQAALQTNPKNRQYREFLGNHYDLLTTVLQSLHEFAQAEEAGRQTAIEREKLVTDFPQVPKFRFALAASQYNLGNLLKEARRFQEAEATYRKTLEGVQELTAKFPDVADYQSLCGATLNNLANILKRRGEWAEALRLMEEAKEHQQAAVKSSPQNRRNRDYLCNHYANLANYLVNIPDPRLRDPVRAIHMANKALELDPEKGGTHVHLGEALYRTGDWSGAVGALMKGLEYSMGSENGARFFLAMAHWQLGNKEQAHKWYDRAMQWMEKNQSEDPEGLRRFRDEAAALLGLKVQRN